MRILFALLACLLFGCSGSSGSVDLPASPYRQADSGIDAAITKAAPCPDPSPLALVVSHHLTDQCTGEVPLGLSGRGTMPVYAWDGAGKLYPVTGTYDGAVYVSVGDRCLSGGDYEGYDLFTLGPPL